MACGPSVCPASWALGAQLEKATLRLWHLQNPSAFQRSAGNVRTAPAASSFSYFISSGPLVGLFTTLSSLPDSMFCCCCCSVQAVRASLLLSLPHVVDPWLHGPPLISKVLRCLVLPLIMHRSRDWEQTGPALATLALGLSCWRGSPLMYEDICGAAAEF